MSKYDALREYLFQQHLNELVLTFNEIEQVLGFRLPRSSERPQWWSNAKGQTSHVQRNAWGTAGYDAFLVAGSNKVKFRKI